MKPVSYYAVSEFTSPKFAYVFARGCKGSMSDDLTYLHDGPMAAFGSPPVWPLLRQAQALGRDYYFGDHGYMGRRKYFRITKNAYQHDGVGARSSERFRLLYRPIQPWRKTGAHILVCPNSAVYFGLHGLNMDQWLSGVQATLRLYTDREIRVRWKVTRDQTMTEDLVNAWAVVVYSSAAAIDALIAGVPIFTLAPFAATVRMGLSDLSRIERPMLPDDRQDFCEVLAANQWTLDEILRGLAWRHLQTHADSQAA